MAKIKIDNALYERLKLVAERAGYASTEEFITDLLERATSDAQDAATDEEVQEQLRGRGTSSDGIPLQGVGAMNAVNAGRAARPEVARSGVAAPPP